MAGKAGELPPFKTEVREETVKTVIATNCSPDLGFDRSIKPLSRLRAWLHLLLREAEPCLLGLLGRARFETKLTAKVNAVEALEKELSRPGYKAATSMLGANTDAYQPVERERKITRGVLEVLERFGHPVAIVTKSALVVRDLDILSRLASRGLAKVSVSVTTLDHGLARKMEPRASTPRRRLEPSGRLRRPACRWRSWPRR